MNIKRVDDKKMEIHKKEKLKLHVEKKTKPSSKKMSIRTKDMAVTGAGAVKQKMISHVEGSEEINGATVKRRS